MPRGRPAPEEFPPFGSSATQRGRSRCSAGSLVFGSSVLRVFLLEKGLADQVKEELSLSDRDRLLGVARRALAAFSGLQKADGEWCGELQGDSILESEYILMKFILGQERQPMAPARDGTVADGWETLLKLAAYLRAQQRDDGGWGLYPGSAVDVSGTVKAYFALKLLGDDPGAPHMVAARDAVVRHGGAENCNSFTKFYLACLGQVSWNAVPAMPPELVFLPRWFYFHMNKVSAWTRTMLLPLSLVVTLRPMRALMTGLGIDELFVDPRLRHKLSNRTKAPAGWAAFFFTMDAIMKAAQLLGGTPVRRVAVRRATEWIVRRAGQDGTSCTDGLGAIFPPMVYLQIALKALGYGREHPVIRRAERELDSFMIEEDGRVRLQPCFSPVWDTGIALYALTDCGMTCAQEPARRASEWLLTKECRHLGDWAANVASDVEPAGWYFEYHNAWYPDCDDTAMVSMALKRAGSSAGLAAADRGVRWLLALQNEDGGWAAFDKTTHRRILEYIPFADHNAMQDPSCADITGRVLECLSWHGFDHGDPAVRRGVEYVKAHQAPEGCWSGRWGVNYIYGTWQAVVGPIRCGEDPRQRWIQRAGAWIKSVQKPDGSFGESADSYLDPSLKGRGPSTASQTAWAAMVLQEIYGRNDPDLLRALDWLARTQLSPEQAADRRVNSDGDPAGSWVEPWFTGTGFPRVFYLRYHLYRLYFPLMALGRFLAAHGVSVVSGGAEAPQPHATERNCCFPG